MAGSSDLDDINSSLKRGEYHRPSPTDLRGPCPMVNTLANHGYIARSGRSISTAEMTAAMSEAGISVTIRRVLSDASWLVHQDTKPTSFWAYVLHPFASLLGHFGLRRPGQVNARGDRILDLDQLSLHNAIEHDVSLSRRDFGEGDNHSPQKDLIADLLASSSNGKFLTTDDFAKFRHHRLEQQQQNNKLLEFGRPQQTLASAEVAFIQTVLGAGQPMYNVPVQYVKAFLEEERLPIEEGWRKRKWWLLGFVELNMQANVFHACYEKVKPN
ncbi:hypothetical protein MMC14_004148 [Varicellaria rhodocarpa]|nr:hypothetical protein [Varicellaria rhodocarpa]